MRRRLLLFSLALVGVAVAALLVALGRGDNGRTEVERVHPPARTAGPPDWSRDEALTIEAAGGLVTVRGERLPLRPLIMEIARAGHLDIKIAPGVDGTIALSCVGQPAVLALEEIVRSERLCIDAREDGFFVAAEEDTRDPVGFRVAIDRLRMTDFERGTVVFRPKDAKDLNAILADLRRETSGAIRVEGINRSIGFVKISFPKTDPVMKVVAALMRDGRVDDPAPDYRAYALAYTPNDPDYALQWHLEKIRCPDAWEVTKGASDVVIAIIDTGIDYDHPDLVGGGTHVIKGWDFINDDDDPMDDHGHGTHCAGIAAGVGDNSLGICGVAPDCSLMAVKVLSSSGGGSYWGIANGVIYAADNGADVISMSLGGGVNAGFLEAAIDYAYSQGCVVLAAAGNDGHFYASYPAGCKNAISVGATDSDDCYAWFTNYNQCTEISAPGVSIYSTIWDDTYTYASGTSMATPCAAGVAGLVRAAFPAMGPQEVRERLWISTVADAWDPHFGYGRIDAAKAVGAPTGYVRAKISWPENNWLFGKRLDISGTAISDDLNRFELEWTQDGSTYYSNGITLAGGGTGNVSEGALGTWDTTSLPNGDYTLRLRAFRNGGANTSACISVTVDNRILPGWPQYIYDRYTDGTEAVVIADIDDDDENEVLVGSSIGLCYVWNHDGTVKPGWPQYGIACTPAVADFDGDGKMEILGHIKSSTLESSDPELYGFHHDGSEIAGFPLDFGWTWKQIVIDDIDGDGELEFLINPGDRTLHAKHIDLTEPPGWPVSFEGAQHCSMAVVADVDGDGKKEVTIGNKLEAFFVFDHDGSTHAIGHRNTIAGFFDPPAVGDINGDGRQEIVFTHSKGVSAFDSDGNELYDFHIYVENGAEAAVTIADIDGDGEANLIAHAGTYLHVLDTGGDEMPGWPVNTYDLGMEYWYESAPPTVADVDDDGEVEIIMPLTNAGLCVFDKAGFLESQYLFDTGVSSITTVADVDKNGTMELAFTMGRNGSFRPKRGYVYILDLDTPFSASRAPWPSLGNEYCRHNRWLKPPGWDVNLPPTASLSADSASGDAPLTVQFDASGSSDPDGSIKKYSWVFDDGARGSGASIVTHTYGIPGIYHAQVTVWDDCGRSDTAYVKIEVTGGPPVTADIHVDDDNVDGPWDGTADNPYRTIQEGFDNAFDGATVYIHSGLYHEATTLLNDSVTVVGDSPDTTVIASPVPGSSRIGISFTGTVRPDIANLAFEGADLVGVKRGGVISNCRFGSLTDAPLQAIWRGVTEAEEIRNCLFVNCDNCGAVPIVDGEPATTKLINNTFAGTAVVVESGTAMEVRNSIFTDQSVSIVSSIPVTRAYNCFHNVADPGTLDATDFVADPLLSASCRLLPGSPCIDAGDPDPAYNDPDGSRNDVGAYCYDGPPTNAPPEIAAWRDQTVVIARRAQLGVRVVDDGLPDPPGACTITWSKFSGPGSVDFDDANAKWATAGFSDVGDYVLRVAVNDGDVEVTDDVNVTVITSTSVPVSRDQTVVTDEDTPVLIHLESQDPNGDPLTYQLVTSPSHGILDPPGLDVERTYYPDQDYHGTDFFTFRTWDGSHYSNVATVLIIINSVPDVPIAEDQIVVAPEATAKTITLAATDGDGDLVTYGIVGGPDHGSLTGTPPEVTYTADVGFRGVDRFTFRANDTVFDSNVATVTVLVHNGYTISDLGEGAAYAVNSSGKVAGQNGDDHAFFWDGVTMQDLGTLGGSNSGAFGINDSDQIVGSADNASFCNRAFLWESGSMTDLGGFPASDRSMATDINSAGHVAGSAEISSFTYHAFYYDGVTMQDLGSIAAGESRGKRINEAGKIAGHTRVPGADHAFFWDSATMQDLGTLGTGDYSWAEGINDHDQLVGRSKISTEVTDFHACLWDSGHAVDLGTLGGQYAYAYAINNRGTIVGSSNGGFSGDHALIVMYGLTVDLNLFLPAASGWTLRGAYDVNDAGHIVGTGTIGGQYHAFLLTPVTPASANHPPAVFAGADQVVNSPGDVDLKGVISDDGKPAVPGAVATTWSRESGPAPVTFGDACELATTATFTMSGEYVIRLSADDGDLAGYDELIVTINQAPTIVSSPWADPNPVYFPNTTTVSVVASDDGLPSACEMTYTWSKVGGPGNVTFDPNGTAASHTSTVSFTAYGQHTLRVTVSDGAAEVTEDVVVDVYNGDTTPPKIDEVPPTENDQAVTVIFTEYVDPVTAETVGNYDIDNGITVLGATLQGDGMTVLLDTTQLSEAITYVLTVNNVRDLAYPVNVIPADSQATFYLGVDLNALVGHWTFDDAAGATALDSSGYDHHGALESYSTGDGPDWTTGKLSGGLDFAGEFDNRDRVRVPNSPKLNATSAITVAAWVWADTWGGGNRRILQKGNSDNQYMFTDASDSLMFSLSGVSGGVITAALPGAGDWHHVAGTYDGSTIIIYIDGAEANSQPANGPISVTSDDLIIGAKWGSVTGDYFDGLLDDVRIYRRALDATEIDGLFHAGDGNSPPTMDAGVDMFVTLPEMAQLTGTANDDGLPNPPASVTVAWSKLSGPGNVIFTEPTSLQTSAIFSVSGSYVLRLTGDDSAAQGSDDIVVTVSAAPAISIPGRIQAEDYGWGGEGNSYHDTTAGNAGGQYRCDDVDVSNAGDIGAGHCVSHIVNGEWLKYDIDVTQAGSYDLTARVAPNGVGSATFHIELGGVDVTGTMTASSDFLPWVDVTAPGVVLAAGPHELTIVMEEDGFSINYLDVQLSGVTNTPPVADAQAVSTPEDTTKAITLTATDGDGDPLTYSIESLPSNGILQNFDPSTGYVEYVPDADYFGPDSFTFKANDGTADSNTAPVSITVDPVNDAPDYLRILPPVVNEDSGPQSTLACTSFDPGPANESGQSVVAYTVSNLSDPGLFATAPSINTSGLLTYTPADDANGTCTFDVTVTDSGGTANGGVDTSPAQAYAIDVLSVNDAPSFTATDPPAVNEDAGAQTVPSWATGFDPGPANESGQTCLGYTVSNLSNPGLFAVAPAVDASGQLTYTPDDDANGTCTFDVAVQDDGGTANGGVDTSPVQTFTITVNSVNDDPVLGAVGNKAPDEGVELAFTLTSTDVDGGAPQYTMTGAPAAATLNINSGAFSWTPGWDEGGNGYNVTFTVSDGAGGSDSEAITITVTEIDDDFDGDNDPDGTDPDDDNDGLDDSDEIAGPGGYAPTDPYDDDSDDDGVTDGDEVNPPGPWGSSDPNDPDSDDDGLDDGEEDAAGTDPNDTDTDDDGLEDDDEVNGVGPWAPTDPLDDDSDNDGLLDGEEVTGVVPWAPTDPNDQDSDDDTWSDGDEVSQGHDPNDGADHPTGGGGGGGGGCSAGRDAGPWGWVISLLALAAALVFRRRGITRSTR